MLLDTDVLIDILRGHEPALEWFAGLEILPGIPGFVAMELVQDADNKIRVERAMKLISPLTIAWPSTSACDRALSAFKSYHLSHSLGLLDALIAATAIELSAPLLTFNAKHYRIVEGLEIRQPYAR